MNYTNQNNVYMPRSSTCNSDSAETKGLSMKKTYPVSNYDDSILNSDDSVAYEQKSSQYCHTGCSHPTQSYPPLPQQPCCPPVQPPCCPPVQPPTPCSCSCQCSCNHPVPDDCNTCHPSENCCTGETCTFNPSQATCLCTYMDVIYDEECANGPTIFKSITATIPNYTIITDFTQNSPCCNPCGISSSSIFTIDNVKTTIKSLTLQNPLDVTTNNILVGGQNVISVTPTNNGGLSAIVNPSVINETCDCKGKGTKSNVLINGLIDWNYLAKYELCGKVTTNGTTCNFKIVVENAATIPGTIPDALTFISDICLPPSEPQEQEFINMQFKGKGQLVNPVITVVGGPAPAPVTLSVSGNLVLNTQAELAVLKNAKVCIQGMLKK